ncbi:Thioredoxin [compost metagenome]
MLLSPRVEQVAQERDDFILAKVNVDEEQDLAIKYGVMSIPTLVLIKDGLEVERSVGLIDREDIIALLDK